MNKKKSTRHLYSWLFYLYAIEGVFALGWLLLIPSDAGRISWVRLLLVSALVLSIVIWIYLGKHPPRNQNKLAQPGYILSFAIFSIVLCLLFFLLRYFDPERLLSIYERLSPLFCYGILLSVQSFFYLLYKYKGFHPSHLLQNKPTYSSSLVAFSILLSLLLFISVTRLGLTFDPAYWGEPGVPILSWQFVLVLIFGTIVLCLSYYFQYSTLEIVLPISIYFLAVGLWLSIPVSVLENSYYMPITAPSYSPFPYSDSSYYDQMAQSLLIGHPYQGAIPIRPIYIVFLTTLHLLFGENYPAILSAQTLLLAFIPVVLYFLGKKLHSHVAGITIALIFIFREFTSLLVSSATRVTNTKMILVDLPTYLFLLLSCVYTFRWLERKIPKDAFIAGGLFGVLLLFRNQSMLIFPFILLSALLAMGWRNRKTYLFSVIFVVGVAVTMAPWLIHNRLAVGGLTLDSTFQSEFFFSHYTYGGNFDITEYNFEGMGLGGVLFQVAIRDPKHVFEFVTNHFLATQVNGLLVLPIIEPFNGLFEPINLYWMNWNGQLAWYNLILLIVYLVIISLGLGVSWRRWRWLGLLPLFYSLGYALATAVARFSSWRYDFPSDWISYFYFGIGFAELLRQTAMLFGLTDPFADVLVLKGEQKESRTLYCLSWPVLASIFIFVGGLPWMIKGLTSPRYSDQSAAMLMSKIQLTDNAPVLEELEGFLSQPGSFIQIGRLLYPRFFFKDKGLVSANPSPAYMIREYSRLGFYLLNQHSTAVVFPTRTIPGPVHHAEDVIILGCQHDTYVEARLIFFPELKSIYGENLMDTPCLP